MEWTVIKFYLFCLSYHISIFTIISGLGIFLDLIMLKHQSFEGYSLMMINIGVEQGGLLNRLKFSRQLRVLINDLQTLLTCLL